MRHSSYDYIFLGMGCASLSLLLRMIRSGGFGDKSFLLIDKVTKSRNDRTWCFWEKENGFFQDIVYKEWPLVSFLGEEFSGELDISPYRYKMIRGIDFYDYCFSEIKNRPGIDLVYANVDGWTENEQGMVFILDGKEYAFPRATVFNSIYEPGQSKRIHTILQHFKGWLVETVKPAFNPSVATMMDFRVGQERGTSFAYVLPFSDRKALVEYTFFTRDLLPAEEYDLLLEKYMNEYVDTGGYSILEKEFGVIPMTDEKLPWKGKGWQIGTAGGQTKASSGYTFQFIQKQSDRILDSLLHKKPLGSLPSVPARFRFYDRVLLHILYHNSYPGRKIFTRLFQKNKPQQVLRFLDNESTLGEELRIIASLPKWPFLKAMMRV